jgi:hypothetical protein
MGNFDIRQVMGFLSLMFGFWPLILLAPLNWRRNSLLGMVYVWIGFAILRILFFLFSINPSVLVIEEPLNTILFFAAGGILFLLFIARNALKRRSLWKKADNARNVKDLIELSPHEFEDLVVEYFQAMGHKAKRTGSIGDHGVDVVIDAINGEKWIAQCKRWRGNVGESIIRDFYGVVQHEKADKGAIITTGVFSNQARDWARGKPILLMEGDEFLSKLKKVRKQPLPSATNDRNGMEEPQNVPLCPKCGRKMVLRTAKQGNNIGEKFWGCSDYPNCRGIVRIG